MTNDVQFNEPGMNYVRPPAGARESFLTGLVMKTGLAKTPKQAQVVLIVIGVIALIIMFIIWPGKERYPEATPVPVETSNPETNSAPAQDDLFNF